MATWIVIGAVGLVVVVIAFALHRQRSGPFDMGHLSRTWVMEHRAEDRDGR